MIVSKRSFKALFFIPVFLGWMHTIVSGQNTAVIIDKYTNENLPGASVIFPEEGRGIYANDQGYFDIPALNSKVIIKFPGYIPDTLFIQASADHSDTLRILLEPRNREPVVITGTMSPSYVSRSPIKVEVLTREFIRQLPAKNVMEVVDYINGVRQQINCGVCGTNDVHINGMEGPYTLVLIDGMPIISALGSVYGLNGIPTSIIERIEIVKGPASTLYGAESVAGTINIITRDPGNAPLLAVESSLNSHLERNADIALTFKNDKVSTMVSGSYYGLDNRIDFNGDNFTDIPLNERISLFNKWSLNRKDNRKFTLAGKAYYEDRFGGVLQWQPSDKGSDSIYGESILTKRAELMGTYQFPVNSVRLQSDFSFSLHDQDSYYGNSHYTARQNIGYANLTAAKRLGRHSLLTGATVRAQEYDDNTPATIFGADKKVIPGIFVQDEYELNAKTTFLGGLRYDYDKDHGNIWSPRLNLKWKAARFSTVRLTTGTGFRNVNIFTEEHAAITGARTVVIEGKLQPERSVNANLNYNQVFNIGESAVTADIDLFYTYFENKIFPDYESDPDLIIYRNLEGYSIIRGAAFHYRQSFIFPLTVELGGAYMEVFSIEDPATGEAQPQLFAPAVSGVFSIGYEIKKWRTKVDYTGKIVGPMHLPTYPEPFQRPEMSDWFSLQNIMLTKSFDHGLSVKTGVVNLLNYTQSSPLINPQQPFSNTFDTAYAWGPLQKRRFIFGLSWTIDQKVHKK